VVGLSDADLEAICASVRAATPGAVCQLANFLFPQGRVVSGERGECVLVKLRVHVHWVGVHQLRHVLAGWGGFAWLRVCW